MKKVVYYIAVMYRRLVPDVQPGPYYEVHYEKANMSHIPNYKGYFESYSQAEHAMFEFPPTDPSWVEPEWSINKVWIDG